jgi:hypothetical protein
MSKETAYILILKLRVDRDIAKLQLFFSTGQLLMQYVDLQNLKANEWFENEIHFKPESDDFLFLAFSSTSFFPKGGNLHIAKIEIAEDSDVSIGKIVPQ